MNQSSADSRQLVEEGQQPKADAGGHGGSRGERENDGSTSAGMSHQSISTQDVLELTEGEPPSGKLHSKRRGRCRAISAANLGLCHRDAPKPSDHEPVGALRAADGWSPNHPRLSLPRPHRGEQAVIVRGLIALTSHVTQRRVRVALKANTA